MSNNGNSNYAFGSRDQRVKEVNRLIILIQFFLSFYFNILIYIIYYRTLMEQENDLRWGELGEQVELLKAVSVFLFCCKYCIL